MTEPALSSGDRPSTSRRRRARSAGSETLSPRTWKRIRDALEDALGEAPAVRRASVEGALAGDPLALSRALGLLGCDDEAPPMATPLESGLPGAGLRVGPWVTLRRLGSGGMGEVFLASRADGAFERLVALKLIRPRAGAEHLVARFRRERQLQAILHHRGIARMLDGGATPDGAPYIVMEYVDGLTIGRYCDEARLNIRERVELFHAVADAVAYAHEHRIVHRDIKPSNIIVGPDGQPKLVDFGIAKGLDSERSLGGDGLTMTGAGFLTPTYASPEQMRGSPMTTATDVYSLGALLHFLLVGRPPFSLEGLSPAEAERQVTTRAPAPPSTLVPELENQAAVCESRCTTDRGLRSAIRGDLDRIVLYCLRKEPHRRYRSVAALRDDLERFLEGRTVVARPDTFVYRTLKFVTRHRLPVGLGAGAVTMLAVGFGYSLDRNRKLRHANASIVAQQSMADERLHSLRSLRQEMVTELKRVLSSVPGALAPSRKMLTILADNLDEELGQGTDDVDLLKQIGETFLLLGSAYQSGRFAHLGDPVAATQCLERAQIALARARSLAPSDDQLVMLTSEVHDELASLLLQSGELSEADTLHQQTLALIELLPTDRRAGNAYVTTAEALTREARSRLLGGAGRLDEAEEECRHAIALWEGQIETSPTMRPIYEGQISILRVGLASILLSAGSAEEGLELIEDATAQLKATLRGHAGGSIGNKAYAVLLRKHARALELLRRAGARAKFDEAVEFARAANESAPDDARSVTDLTSALLDTGEFLLRREAWTPAHRYLQEAHELVVESGERWTQSASWQIRMGRANLAIGQLSLGQGDLLAASSSLSRALVILEELHSNGNENFSIRRFLSSTFAEHAALHLAQLDALGAVAEDAVAREREAAATWLQRAEQLWLDEDQRDLMDAGQRERLSALRSELDS